MKINKKTNLNKGVAWAFGGEVHFFSLSLPFTSSSSHLLSLFLSYIYIYIYIYRIQALFNKVCLYVHVEVPFDILTNVKKIKQKTNINLTNNNNDKYIKINIQK